MNLTKNTTFDIATAPKRDSKTWKQGTITWGEILDWMESPADVKEAGNYVLGKLKGDRRVKSALLSRDALTLDVDDPEPGFLADAAMLGYTALVHTTYKSTPDVPRYRVIIPLSRTVAPDEYHVCAAAVMQELGEAQFDEGSVQPERYMFKPSENTPGYFHWEVFGAGLADVDALLEGWEQDLSELPPPKVGKNKRDPLELPGTVGAFNRVYSDLDDLIESYNLPYQQVGDDRYQLIGASAAAGMGPVQGAPHLYYSHHTHDPAYGVTCSAFDLVRLHRFGHLDENSKPNTPVNKLPSTLEMEKVATKDARVVRELIGADFSAELDDIADDVDDDSWRTRFNLNSRTGKPTDDVHNWDLIKKYDRVFKALYYNELTLATEVDGQLPWREVRPETMTFDKRDIYSTILYIEREYGLKTNQQQVDILVADSTQRRRRNKVREYLDSLEWDGYPRLETCLPGVALTKYTRLVARKCLVAAVARMLQPGIKWDHMLMIYGTEGLGKSYWIEKMSKGWSASLGKIGDKDTLITMQRTWIMTSDEGHSLKKAEFDALKEFVTKTSDVTRMPYDREAREYKRHSVIWGTTNDPVFLRRQEGNRRFLIVRAEEKVDFDKFSEHYVDQIWAEAVHLFRQGEELFLSDEQARLAALNREEFIQEDALSGIVQNYLDTPVPADWEFKSPMSRQEWLQNRGDGFTEVGTELHQEVCTLQIWTEAMQRKMGDHRGIDLMEIANALRDMPGWAQMPGRKHVPHYGQQVVFRRLSDEEQAAVDDLI